MPAKKSEFIWNKTKVANDLAAQAKTPDPKYDYTWTDNPAAVMAGVLEEPANVQAWKAVSEIAVDGSKLSAGSISWEDVKAGNIVPGNIVSGSDVYDDGYLHAKEMHAVFKQLKNLGVHVKAVETSQHADEAITMEVKFVVSGWKGVKDWKVAQNMNIAINEA